MKQLEVIYDMIMEESGEPENELVKDPLMRAAKMVAGANQRLYIAKQTSIDIGELGIGDERKQGRRKMDRRNVE